MTTITAQGNYLDGLLAERMLDRTPSRATQSNLPKNREWLKQAFMLDTDSRGNVQLDDVDRKARMFSSATLSYTDTSLGGSIAINPPPQWTIYADLPDPGLHAQNHSWLGSGIGDIPMYPSISMPENKLTSYGEGRCYAEVIKDNSQVVHFRFGKPTYNSLTQFFTGFYNSGLASIARSGRYNSEMTNGLLRLLGNAVGLAIAPLFLVPIAVLFVGTALRFALGVPSTKFYYMKPTMPVYWSVAGTILNQFSSLLGMSNSIQTNQAQEILKMGDGGTTGGLGNVSSSNTIQNVMSQFIPDEMMDSKGHLDIRSIASRSKRLQTQFNKTLTDTLEKASRGSNYEQLIREAFSRTRSKGLKPRDAFKDPETYMQQWITSWFGAAPKTSAPSGSAKSLDESISSKADAGSKIEGDFRAEVTKKDGSKDGFLNNAIATTRQSVAKAASFFIAEVADGSDWLSVRVDYTGPTSESFDNSFAPSQLAGKINDMSASNRETRINLADGNLLPGMGDIVEAAKQVVSGAAEVLQIDGIAALAGSAFVDIPDHWANSHATLPRYEYTVKLISPYGNVVSQMLDIYIPLSCLMAAALPLATGAQSYTDPFLCQVHDRGRGFTRLAMFESLRISRGTSNLGFTQDGRALAIDVTFTVRDLSSVMALPVNNGFSILNPLQGLMDDQTAFQDYAMAVCGLSLGDCIYKVPMMKYRINQKIQDFKSYFSASHIASALTNVPGVAILNAVFRGTNR